MESEKINILFEFKNGPWGGGNQFLLALKKYFIKNNYYENNPKNSNIILVNSFHNSTFAFLLKLLKPKNISIMRLDGPTFLIREKDLNIDKKIYYINKKIIDGTIFQSEWSRKENYKLGLKRNKFETVILNAPDPNIFNKNNKSNFTNKKRVKLIATSWSSNINKGFDTYHWLDENLDFTKYKMTFIGNTPIKFKNIKHLQPLTSVKLAKQLKKHDIYITASKKDTCSNSLIEAMHCGLPAIGLNDGGHPEIIKNGGEVFNKPTEIPNLILKITKNYKLYQSKINLPTMDEIGKEYYIFIQKVYLESIKEKSNKKTITIFDLINIVLNEFKINLLNTIHAGLKKL